jgi:hypothetical protein
MLRVRSKRTASDPNAYAESLKNPAAYAKRAKQTGPGQAKKNNSVGYCCPPAHRQFKSGQSGNPRGRPPGSRSLRSAVEKIFTDKITIHEGSKVRKITRLEAVLLTNLNQALKGDQKAIRAVHATSTALGLMDVRPQKLELGELSSFTDAELQEFKRLLEKASAKVVPK